MTQEERNLLIKDLCGRLPYGVIAKKEYSFVFTNGTISKSKEIEKIDLEDIEYLISGDNCVDVLKPYLRPMSSMTEEEKDELFRLSTMGNGGVNTDWESFGVEIISTHPRYGDNYSTDYSAIDWLNKKMFDYRGLIKKGLALEDKEGMYSN